MDYPQFGFVVSKKISKSAVVRNTLRRRVSAIVEENFQLFSTPIKAVVLIKKDFSPIKPQDLQKQLMELLKKAAQWKSCSSKASSFIKTRFRPIMVHAKPIIHMDTAGTTRHAVSIRS